MKHSANKWHHELDQVDPFFGDKEELELLCRNAPNPKVATWLIARIEENERFKTAFFEREAANGDIFNPPLLFQDSAEGQRFVLKMALEDAQCVIKKTRAQRWICLFVGAVFGFAVAGGFANTFNSPMLPTLPTEPMPAYQR